MDDQTQTALHAINGTTGDHYGLCRYCEDKGLFISPDPDDMQLSYVCLSDPGEVDDFWSTVVGEIRGDEEASIEILESIE
jgi:hypothetical protein